MNNNKSPYLGVDKEVEILLNKKDNTITDLPKTLECFDCWEKDAMQLFGEDYVCKYCNRAYEAYDYADYVKHMNEEFD